MHTLFLPDSVRGEVVSDSDTLSGLNRTVTGVSLLGRVSEVKGPREHPSPVRYPPEEPTVTVFLVSGPTKSRRSSLRGPRLLNWTLLRLRRSSQEVGSGPRL